MPNTGHRWSEGEDRAALVSWPLYDVFCIVLGRDDITYHAFRHRVRYLRSLPPAPSLLARLRAWLRWGVRP